MSTCNHSLKLGKMTSEGAYMKSMTWLLGICVMICLIGVSIPQYAQGAEPVIKLKYSIYSPPTHQMAVLAGQFCEEMKKRTKGRVEISLFAGGTLTTATKVFNGVVTGISDIGMSNIAYTRGRFPQSEVLDLPIGFPSGYVATQVAQDFFNKTKPKEFDSVHMLYIHGCGPNVINTTKKPVRTLADLKGLKLRGTGRVADVVKALGATPIPLEMADIYDSMSRGVVDGVLISTNNLKDWKIGELIKTVTASWKLGGVYTFYVVMNKDKWKSLPEDIKKIFNEVSEEYKNKTGIAWNQMDIDGIEYMKKRGGQMINLSDDESKRWQNSVESLIAGYVKNMESLGFKKSETEANIRFVRERIKYWRNKEKELKIPTPF